MRNILQRLASLFSAHPKKAATHNSANLSPEKASIVLQQLEVLMHDGKPYLKQGFNIKDLAEELTIPCYQLSAFLNRQMKTRFNDYINQYRVEHCKEMIMSGAARTLNLKGLATDCGFSNRNTFTVAFKKFTGLTPSAYASRFKKKPGKYVFLDTMVEKVG